ncbi:MAG: efflux RND transporter permease subunit [Bacteroidota bacterium]
MKLTEIAIKRPAFMTMIFSALAVMGIFSYSNMGVDLLPKMEWPMVFVSTIYPGAGPKEIETQVSKPVEDALSSLNGLKSLRTYSAENASFALVEYNMDVDVNIALNEVERKINEIRLNLPKDVKQPQITKADINSMPIMRVSLTSNMKSIDFFQYIKDNIKTKLEQVPGVASVLIVGGKEREIKIEVDNEKLKSYNLSILNVSQILAMENIDFPTGKVEGKENSYIVRVAGKYTDLNMVNNLIIAETPFGKIQLKDVAKIVDTYKENYTISRLQNVSSIGLIIQKASDANSIKTSDKVQKVFSTLEAQNKNKDLHFTIAQDITNFTRNSVNDVLRDLMMAILLVAIILFLFLHDIKNSFIVLLSIPTSLISAFIMMNIFGFTINVITLLALTLVVGILVDDSIVVLENIHRHLEKGENQKDAALKGRSEIGMAAIAITLVDVVVFLPIAMLSGIVGKIFREFGLTIVVSTLFSLFVSFTLTPMLASRWSKVVHFSKEKLLGKLVIGFEGLIFRITAAYRKILIWALNHRKTVIGISFALIFTSMTFIPLGLIGTEFMPNADRGEFALNMEMPFGTTLDKTNDATVKVEEIVRNLPEVNKYYTVVGRHEVSFGSAERSYYSQVQISLIPANKRKPTQEIINELLEKTSKIPGLKVNASLIGMFGAADEAPIAIEVKGIELEKIIAASEKVQDVATKTKGTRDIRTSWEEGQPEIQVQIDRDKCAVYSLSLTEVALALRNAFEGDISTKYKENDTEYDMRVILAKKDRENPTDVSNMIIQNRFGQQIKLAEIAIIKYGKSPSQIARKDRSRVITISTNLDNSKPMGDVVGEIEKGVQNLNLGSDVEINFAGASEDMSNMFMDMMLAIMFAIIFVYMIMVSLYESYLYPFVIMFSLPVAIVGSLTGLALTGNNLNIFSMIGLLLSMGLVTKNAILLVDYTNNLRAQGMGMRDALLTAGPIRLRPILMTTLTMVFGMMPLAIGAGSGGEFRSGLAVVVIGALISSTMLTLVLIPVVYTIMEGLKDKVKRLISKIKTTKPTPGSLSTDHLQLPDFINEKPDNE